MHNIAAWLNALFVFAWKMTTAIKVWRDVVMYMTPQLEVIYDDEVLPWWCAHMWRGNAKMLYESNDQDILQWMSLSTLKLGAK